MTHTYTFPVDLTTIMLFASALGETNRIYYDEPYARETPLGGVVAPPTFAFAAHLWEPGYYLRGVRRIPAPAEPDASPDTGGAPAQPPGDLRRALHGEIHFEYHKPIRPGMRLRVTTRPGRAWEKTGQRSGTMRLVETITEYWDEHNEPVVTTRSISIYPSNAADEPS